MIPIVREACVSAEIVPVLDTRARRMRSFARGLFEMEACAYCHSAGFDDRARRFLVDHDIDVVHIVHPWLMNAVANVLPRSRRKATRLIGHVIDVHTAVVRRRLSRAPSLRLLKEYVWASETEFRHYSRMDGLLIHTQTDADMIAERLGGGPLARLIPVWFDAISSPRPDIALRAPSDKFLVVGTSSDPRMRESVDWLLERVWPFVVARHPAATLHLYSVRPEHAGRWQGTPGLVAHTYVDDLLAVYDEACALLFPLRSGGYSRHLKVLNAMARGCPIIMTSEANTAEQLFDGREALIRDDAEGFVSAMSGLLQAHAEAVHLARAAQQRVAQAYQGFDTAQALLELYDL